MPLIAVEVDGHRIAAVRCEDFHVVDACVIGSVVDPQVATVQLTASTHPESGEGTFLLWLDEMKLKPGQVVSFAFLADGDAVGTGKTIDQLYPDGDSREPPPEKTLEDCIRELRLRPNLRSGYKFSASTPTFPSHSSGTEPGEFSFSFRLLWNWLREGRASLSLSTWSIEYIESHEGSREHFREYVGLGQRGTLRIDT